MVDNFFSGNLRFLREQRGLSQDGLCLEIGCSKSALSQYERGESEPTLHVIRNIVHYFGVTFDRITDVDLSKSPLIALEPEPEYKAVSKELERLRIQNETLKQALNEIGKGLKSKP